MRKKDSGNDRIRRLPVRPPPAEEEEFEDEVEEGEEEEEEIEYDEEGLYDDEDVNDPHVQDLAEPPLLGTTGQDVDMFGTRARSVGVATSPKLMTQASRFPNAVQLRVWKIENGIPTGLGVIDAEATEEDLVTAFYNAMPRPGEGKAKFQLRPLDIHGNELGKQITVIISEHHATLSAIRERARMEAAEREGHMFGRGQQGPGEVHVHNMSGGDGGAASYAEEMGRMFEQAVGASEERTRQLQTALEMERERLREEEKSRLAERISLAERSTTVVEKMTERLMAADRARADETIKAQRDQSQLITQTLTSVFENQNRAQREEAQRMRDMDAHRLAQDREFFERQRQQQELQRQYEREEAERRRQEEKDRMQAEMERRENEMRVRLERDRLEMERERERQREERERWRQELEEKRRAEQMEWERKQQVAKEEAERLRREIEDKRQLEREMEERRLAVLREDAERKERLERERMERERLDLIARMERDKLEFEKKREEDRLEAERRERERREEAERRERAWREELSEKEARRREEQALAIKQMEMQAQRDREHAERMLEMARIERESQREAQLAREKAEREAREQQEADRRRQHELQMREMELAKERDREHAERMLHLSKASQAGGLGAVGELLGMNTPELFERIFGGKDDGGGGGWAENLPKMLGSLADLGSKLVSRSDGRAQAAPRMIPQYVVPDPRMHPGAVVPGMAPGMPMGQPVSAPPAQPQAQPQAQAQPQPQEVSPASALSPYQQGKKVNTLGRAKEAGIPLVAQKKARKAIASLADQLKELDLDSDEGIEAALGFVGAAVIETPEILDYLAAVTVYAAFAESGASEELVERVVKFMKDSEMVDLPYTDEDLNTEVDDE